MGYALILQERAFQQMDLFGGNDDYIPPFSEQMADCEDPFVDASIAFEETHPRKRK